MTTSENLLTYHAWANEKVLQYLSTLPDGVVNHELQSVFPSISATLTHLYVADNMWLALMRGQDNTAIFAHLPVWESEVKGAAIEDVCTRFSAVAQRYLDFVTTLPDRDAYADYAHPTAGTLRARYTDIVQHVVNHGTYHRGNVTAMLRQMGIPGVATDYLWYLFAQQNAGGA